MEAIRTFIALKLSPEVEEELGQIIGELRKAGGGAKWVDPASIHLTLKFLGEINQAKLAEVCAAVQDAAHTAHAFQLQLQGTGAFPSFRNPRVFWVGLKEQNSDQLIRLQEQLEQRMEACGFPREKRPFSPHLTLGRVRDPRAAQAGARLLQTISPAPLSFPVEELLVMRSELAAGGARYSVQKSFRLGNL